ncbi:SRPBCC family protein [Blastococcus saxobsidens]|uniref:SRPBCC family protein n=1 Tax=Blastococcus saxobsidens TaxID=138336 RepID=A0A6L9W5N4_9ACTN|nr:MULTISPECIES: SRPBCC family protein [Blastococcus]NEK87328.1 SRPBCC family protein [Blastococcus saxobsidens]
MQLTNEFDVSVPVEEAWRLLTDLERVGPCLPGASITGRDGEDYLGQAKIKVGPITANYKGTARFIELDETERRAVLSAKGRESRGGGDAQAVVTATLVDKGDVTHVTVLTDLTLSGKVAQFGRGVINDVSTALLKTFVTRLEAMVQQQPEESAPEPAAAGTRTDSRPGTDAQPPRSRGSEPDRLRPATAPAADDHEDVLSVLTLARSITASKLQQPVPLGAALLAALFAYLLGRRRS